MAKKGDTPGLGKGSGENDECTNTNAIVYALVKPYTIVKPHPLIKSHACVKPHWKTVGETATLDRARRIFSPIIKLVQFEFWRITARLPEAYI